MAYHSRSYLKEKWDKAKWDMENVLEVNNPNTFDKINDELISKTKDNIVDSLKAIIKELEK